jgi:8-oxo-dGTP pyrophosphatase MutT (NUDIX family)
VDPRPASTIIVARDGSPGVEVLMLKRSPESRFAPGYAVFPGGSLEPGDAELASRWFADDEEVARACALRELAEETGLAFTSKGLEESRSSHDALRMVSNDPPSVADMPEISRWIAPEFLRVRFDARFFAIEASRGFTPRPDGVEIEVAWWARPDDVLKQYQLWESLMWPTFAMLRALSRCRSLGEILELQVAQRPPPPRAGQSPDR